jgi:hypothetical protein
MDDTIPMIRASWNGEIAIILAILLTVILYFLIPATSPGFPRPLMTHIYYSNITTPDGDRIYNLDGRVINEGTRGKVIITASLVNASNQTTMTNSSREVFMLEHEEKSVTFQLSGQAKEPYDIHFTAKRK